MLLCIPEYSVRVSVESYAQNYQSLHSERNFISVLPDHFCFDLCPSYGENSPVNGFNGQQRCELHRHLKTFSLVNAIVLDTHHSHIAPDINFDRIGQTVR